MRAQTPTWRGGCIVPEAIAAICASVEQVMRVKAFSKRPSMAWKVAIAWAVAALHVATYHAVAALSLRPERHFLTGLDELIPFLPWTVWLYMPMWIVFFHVVLVVVQRWSTFWRGVASVGVASAIAYVVFVLFPSTYPRPELVDDGSWTTQLLLLVRAFDRANNTFPSLHVAMPFTLALAVWRENAQAGRRLLWLALVPALATLTVKQHYVVDVAGGVALAIVVHAVVFGWRRAARLIDTSGPAHPLTTPG